MKFFQYISVYFSLFLCTTIVAQQEKTNYHRDSLAVDNLLSKIEEYHSKNMDSLLKDGRRALEISERINTIDQQYKLHRILGIMLAERGSKENYAKAILHFKRALKLSSKKGNQDQVISMTNNLSGVHFYQGDYSKALKYNIQVIEAAKKIKKDTVRHTMLGASFNVSAMIYKKILMPDSSMINYKRSASHYKLSDPIGYSTALNNLGALHSNQGNYEESFVCYKKALEGTRKNNSKLKEAIITLNLGELSVNLENYPEAIKYFKSTLKLSTENGYKKNQLLSYVGLTETYYFLKKKDSALLYLNRAFSLCDSLKSIDVKERLLFIKANRLQEAGDYKEASNYFKLHKELKDSLDKSNTIAKTTGVLINNQQKITEKKVDGLLNIVSKQYRWIYVFMASILILGILAYVIFKRYRSRLKTSKIDKKMLEASLQSEKDNNAYINRKLVAATANLALKTDLLSKVNDLLGQIKNQPSQNLTKEINETQTQIKIQKNMDTMWKEFFIHFEEVHPEFLKDLKSRYNITQHDLKICAFLKMNLSNKEICQLMNINPTTVRVNIHRIKKKLNIPKETSVVEFFSVN
ncbi:tetratricopeptide repeat protein [Aquimarina mytili]|uniref:Tetratricopeptide repeat protein n=1 Tax=Aquimarina mytili TaxID=874423 RepID=A0A936ZVM2_9FLAO|nr:tetratricopeptide repeat protein [Aquimarina mytili]MBL0683031.1 tetratricopeptide repeat protein [Aquimarina mytili]